MNKMKMAAKMHDIMWKREGFQQNYLISYTLDTNYNGVTGLFPLFYGSSICELAKWLVGPILLLLPHLEIQDGRK